MQIIGWILCYWLFGIIAGDKTHNPKMKHVQGHYSGTLCRKWCYMSGTFYDAAVRPLVPWPIRKGPYFECPQENDRDYCTGEVFRNGRWQPSMALIEGNFCSQAQELEAGVCRPKSTAKPKGTAGGEGKP